MGMDDDETVVEKLAPTVRSQNIDLRFTAVKLNFPYDGPKYTVE